MEQQLVEREGSNYSIDEHQSSSSIIGGGSSSSSISISCVDLDLKNNDDIHWTDEKHWHFLRLMEDSFVKSMFQINNNNNGGNGSWFRRHDRINKLRLDRHVPDSSESTLDDGKKDIAVKAKGRENISYSSTDEVGSSSTGDKIDPRNSSIRRQRRRLATADHRYSIISHDQVVPAVGVSKG